MNVFDFIDASVSSRRDKCAFMDKDEAITYGELYKRIRSIATALALKIPGKNNPVVVFIDRDVAGICCLLGIALSGNFYVPIDAGQPIERIKLMLKSIEPAGIIDRGRVSEEIAQTELIFKYEDIIDTPVRDDLLDLIRERLKDTDPLYALYTSGSTGVPKGVLISHRSILDFIPVFTKTFGLKEDDIFGNQAPFDFDVSVKDIYSSLYLGATVYIIPRVCFTMPKKLVEALDDNRITVIIWAVSAMCIAAGFNVFKHRVPGNLRRIMFSGEVMPIKMLNVWRKNIPDAMYVNLYGPTEITCNCTYYILDPHREYEASQTLPIGKPFENEEVLVLKDDRPVTTGETGEICVLGSCLALGYYNNPEKTREVFVQNPLNTKYAEKMYRTGDLCRLSEDGEYYFSGRKDFQIKHMGHRIELEEIELGFNAVPGVERACCIFDEDRNKILGFYTGTADSKFIVEQMLKVLPKYMIPNIIECIEAFPITKNGKIDRKALLDL